MCRSTEFDGLYSPGDGKRINIGAFYVKLLGLGKKQTNPLPVSLTLLFRPRIDDAGSEVRPGSRAYVSLHRGVAGSEEEKEEAVFGSRERLVAADGVRFEVFLREEKVLEGMFRRGEQEWRMEVRSGVEEGRDADVAAVEVCVGFDGHVALSERVKIAGKKKKKNKKRIFNNRLEVIPEEVGESDGLCCCIGDGGYGEGSDGWDYELEGCGPDCRELEGVKWAVDVGIWVMCLGLGYLVSKASTKSLRRSLRARSRIL